MSISKISQRAALVVATVATLAASTGAASATTILTYGQVGNGSPITGTQTGSTTTISTTDTAISITQIDSVSPTPVPLNAYLTLSLTSTSAAAVIGSYIMENFSGSFSITSGTGRGGTNYLSGTFVDVAFGQNTAFTLSASTPPAGAVTFTSSVIADLGLDRGASLSFANVTPGLSITNNTISSFTSSVSGTFSGQPIPTVPEPASLGLLGAGLFGAGLLRRRQSV